MKRYHLELERTKRAHKLHLRSAHSPDSPVDCICEFQAGRFRKQKALGCGRARCLLCHFEKIFGFRRWVIAYASSASLIRLKTIGQETN